MGEIKNRGGRYCPIQRFYYSSAVVKALDANGMEFDEEQYSVIDLQPYTADGLVHIRRWPAKQPVCFCEEGFRR